MDSFLARAAPSSTLGETPAAEGSSEEHMVLRVSLWRAEVGLEYYELSIDLPRCGSVEVADSERERVNHHLGDKLRVVSVCPKDVPSSREEGHHRQPPPTTTASPGQLATPSLANRNTNTPLRRDRIPSSFRSH